ncbi:MAG: hypothetical protein ABIH23_20245 [bacterium]
MASWNDREREEIEFRIAAVQKFLDLWQQLNGMFQRAYRQEDVSQQDEEEFLKLKSTLARRHQYLMEYLSEEYDMGMPITALLSDMVTLNNMQGIHSDFYRKLRAQWHTTFLALNSALGYLMVHLEEQTPLPS